MRVGDEERAAGPEDLHGDDGVGAPQVDEVDTTPGRGVQLPAELEALP